MFTISYVFYTQCLYYIQYLYSLLSLHTVSVLHTASTLLICVHTISVYTQYLSYHYVYTQHLYHIFSVRLCSQYLMYSFITITHIVCITHSIFPINMYAHNILLICMHTISVYCVHSILCILVFRYTVFLPTRMYHSYLLCILVLVACIKQYPYSWVYSISFRFNA